MRRAWRKAGLAAALIGAGAGAGCAMIETPAPLADPPIAPSPVAARVLEASRNPGPYPKWTDFPAMPRDVRPEAEWGPAIAAVRTAGVELSAEVAERPQILFGTEAWAAEQAQLAAPPPQLTTTTTEEFLSATRKAAAPPSPPR
jgi:hypothetical protein